MQHLINIVEQHTLLIVFFNVLLSRGGLPLPVLPTLLTAAALAAGRPDQIGEIILAGIGGTLVADFALFWCGLRYGQRFLALLCRVSFSPDLCVRRTTAVYTRMGWWSLPFAKFIPGLSLIAVAMAGVSKMPVLAFLLLDGLGALLFVSASVALGVIFQNAITSVLSTLAEFGMLGNLAVVAALALYLLTKWWRRQLFIRQLRMNRITVAELRKLIEDGEELVILDVRPKEIRAQDGIIPGAIAAHPEDIDPIVRDLSHRPGDYRVLRVSERGIRCHRCQTSQAGGIQENTTPAGRDRCVGGCRTSHRTRRARRKGDAVGGRRARGGCLDCSPQNENTFIG